MFTTAASEAATVMATGKTIRECFLINKSAILDQLPGMPADHVHCTLLSAMTFQKALAQCVRKG